MMKNMKWLGLGLILVAIIGVVWWSMSGGDLVGEKSDKKDREAPIVQDPIKTSPLASAESLVAVPVKVSIPKIKVETVVEQVGLDNLGRMDVPKDFKNVGWYNLGYRPGEAGGAVFAGHLDTVSGKPAVFWNLNKLVVGDEIVVTGEDGKVMKFMVTDKQRYKANQFPMEKVFNNSDPQVLALITCTGTFDRSVRNYTERLVVYSKLKTT